MLFLHSQGKKAGERILNKHAQSGEEKTKTRMENVASKPNKPPIFPDTDVLTDNWLIHAMYKKDRN